MLFHPHLLIVAEVTRPTRCSLLPGKWIPFAEVQRLSQRLSTAGSARHGVSEKDLEGARQLDAHGATGRARLNATVVVGGGHSDTKGRPKCALVRLSRATTRGDSLAWGTRTGVRDGRRAGIKALTDGSRWDWRWIHPCSRRFGGG